MNKITFTNAKGFVVAVIYNEISDEKKAIDVASMYVVNKYKHARLERV